MNLTLEETVEQGIAAEIEGEFSTDLVGSLQAKVVKVSKEEPKPKPKPKPKPTPKPKPGK